MTARVFTVNSATRGSRSMRERSTYRTEGGGRNRKKLQSFSSKIVLVFDRVYFRIKQVVAHLKRLLSTVEC